MNNESEEDQTSWRILAYLVDNPNAQDTLEGIVEWWMLQQKIKHSIAPVRKVVEDLTHNGVSAGKQSPRDHQMIPGESRKVSGNLVAPRKRPGIESLSIRRAVIGVLRLIRTSGKHTIPLGCRFSVGPLRRPED